MFERISLKSTKSRKNSVVSSVYCQISSGLVCNGISSPLIVGSPLTFAEQSSDVKIKRIGEIRQPYRTPRSIINELEI